MAIDDTKVAELIAKDGYTIAEYPPEAVKNTMGKLFRPIPRESAAGDVRMEYRPVIFTGRSDEAVKADKDTAREKRVDCYDPDYGWIVEGYKLAKDRDVMSIMAEVRS